ncbi:MAG: hypothetical protein AAGI91_10060 [Bacteroidota bacterium]
MRLPLALLSALLLSGCTGLAEALDEAFPTYVAADVESVTLLSLPPSKPGGGAWDLSGAADPFVVIRAESGAVLYTGSVVENAVPSRYPLPWAVSGVRVGTDDVVWFEVYDDDVAEDDVVARYRVRLADVGGLVKPATFPLLGPGGQPMAEVRVRWIEAAG